MRNNGQQFAYRRSSIFPVTICHSPAVLEIPPGEEPDYEKVMQEWNKISAAWCSPDDLPEQVIQDAYECFRQNRGELEHNLQVGCEKKIFPDTFSKNAIRKKMCELDPRTTARFEECYSEGGEDSIQEMKQELNLPKPVLHQRKVNEFHQFERLTICMRRAFGWDDGKPLIKPITFQESIPYLASDYGE